jgi:hypothetical protein
MKERYILEALQKAVTEAATLVSLDVKYVARNITLPANGRYLEIVHIPNNIENENWDDSRTYRGIMRLILHWKMDDRGAYEALDKLKTISEYFIKGLKLTDPLNQVVVTITDNANVSDIIEKPPELLIPLTIRYSYFSA